MSRGLLKPEEPMVPTTKLMMVVIPSLTAALAKPLIKLHCIPNSILYLVLLGKGPAYPKAVPT